MKYFFKYLFGSLVYLLVNAGCLLWTLKPYETNYKNCIYKVNKDSDIGFRIMIFMVILFFIFVIYHVVILKSC